MLEKIRLWHIKALVVILILSFGLGYLLNMKSNKRVKVQNLQIINLESALVNSNKAKAKASVEVQTMQAQLDKLNEQQRQLFSENAALKKELVFYQRIMAPETVINGVTLDSLIFTPEVSENYYYMQVVLVQVQKNKRHIKAQGELTVYGSMDGKPAEYTWKELRDKKNESLDFSFRYFQGIEATIKFPTGFVPERVTFAADIKGNRWNSGIKLNQSFEWGSVLKMNGTFAAE